MILNVIQLIGAFALIVGLVVLVLVLYVINRRTPLPPGCEDLKIDASKCQTCNNVGCGMKKYLNDKKEGETTLK